jgi:hypothetical protein
VSKNNLRRFVSDSTQDDIPRPLPPNSHFELTGEYQFLLIFRVTAPLLDIYVAPVSNPTGRLEPSHGETGVLAPMTPRVLQHRG